MRLFTRITLFAFLLAVGSSTLCAQDSIPYNWRPVVPVYKKPNSFFMPDTALNKKRLKPIAGLFIGGYTAAYTAISITWYSGYEKSKFHWFNDIGEWKQIDKLGHAFGGYVGARGMAGLLKWSGLNRKQVAIYSGISGFLPMVPLEILDGFSKDWGASAWDLGADFAGAALCSANELLWSEQRIQMKVSYHPTAYAQIRPDLFGDSYTKYLKDYNGHTGWLSFRIHSFLPESRLKDKFPMWLNVAAGYGANGMLGGYVDGKVTPEIREREYSQYYLALDIDFTQIPTSSGFLDCLFGILNVVKFPSPTLEYNRKLGLRWHWIYM